jgi:hypothetical protein
MKKLALLAIPAAIVLAFATNALADGKGVYSDNCAKVHGSWLGYSGAPFPFLPLRNRPKHSTFNSQGHSLRTVLENWASNVELNVEDFQAHGMPK